MNENKEKLKKLEPLLRMRKIELEQEQNRLLNLNQEKIRCEIELKKTQNNYLMSANKLNMVRKKNDKSAIVSVEYEVDFLKKKWMVAYREKSLLEGRIEVQYRAVIAARNSLQVVEKLQDKYIALYKEHLEKKDQEANFDIFSQQSALKKRNK